MSDSLTDRLRTELVRRTFTAAFDSAKLGDVTDEYSYLAALQMIFEAMGDLGEGNPTRHKVLTAVATALDVTP